MYIRIILEFFEKNTNGPDIAFVFTKLRKKTTTIQNWLSYRPDFIILWLSYNNNNNKKKIINVKPSSYKISRENAGENLYDHGLGKDF